MNRLLLLAICLLSYQLTYAQKAQYINSGEILSAAKAAYDTGNNEVAIKQFLTIHERDTNYVQMLSDLAFAYIENKQYDKALETVEKGLKEPSPIRSSFLSAKGIALDRSGEYQKAIDFFNKAIEDYPTEFYLVYNLGNVYYNKKEFDKAREYFFRVLTINPFHSYSHLNLGAIAIKQDRKVQGMLSYAMYLAIKETDNERLVILDKFVSNQFLEEEPVPSTTPNAFEKLDQIIRAKMAMDKNFKSQFPIDAAVVKQYEMLFQQLDLNNKDTNDPWLNYYLPIFKAIQTQNELEPFMYHLLSSTSFDQVKKWQKKNDKVLKTYFQHLNDELKKKRLKPVLPSGFEAGVSGWYTDSGDLGAIGNEDKDGENIGKWKYFHENGELRSEGSYAPGGKKSGVWKYYNKNAKLITEEHYDNGETTSYYKGGGKHEYYFLKDGKIHGTVLIYHPCGPLKEKLDYVNGTAEGPGETYYPNGSIKNKYTQVAGKLTGEYLTYYGNGKLKSKYFHKEGVPDGPFVEYHRNGKISSEGNYKNDELDGVWKYYHSNGQVSLTGTYKKSRGVGTWTYYDYRGDLTEKRTFDDTGKLNGENIFYSAGNLTSIYTYKNGIPVQVIFYKSDKTEIAKYGNKDGSFTFKTYFPTGQVKSEGAFKKGELDGKVKYFFRTGQQLSESTYVGGTRNGPFVDYFQSGAKKVTGTYVDGELDGYYQEFYEHGQLKSEGYYKNGERQQQWLDYFSDGTIESDYYFWNDEPYNNNYDYNVDGKLYSLYNYEKGSYITDIKRFNLKEENVIKVSSVGPKVIFEERYSNKKTAQKLEILCGEYDQTLQKMTPDGTIYFSAQLVESKRNGNYKYYDFSGTLITDGNYEMGKPDGLWKGYGSNGKPDYVGRYVNFKSDSIWTYYYPSGEVSSQIPYFDDNRSGIAKYFAPDGTLMVEKKFEDDDFVAYREMTAKGTLGEWINFTGNANITAYYPNGSKSLEEVYKNGLIDGLKRIFFSNGKVCNETNFSHGDYQGPFFSSYSNGKLYKKGQYVYDGLNGKLECYNPDGSLLKTEEYVRGTKNGKSILFKNGVKLKEVTFFGGQPHD
jgi:uncharacterized protein